MKIPMTFVDNRVTTPRYSSEFAGWMDLHAWFPEDYATAVIMPGESALIGTGIKSAIPIGWRVKFSDRSGLSNKSKLIRLGGCIDSDYRGEWMVGLFNLGRYPRTIAHGDKIVQFSIEQAIPIEIETVDKLPETTRAEGGFGSTGQ